MIKEDVSHKAAEAITGAATKATYGGAGTAIVFGMKAADFAALAGVVIGVIGLIINTYYKHKMYKLEQKRKDGEL